MHRTSRPSLIAVLAFVTVSGCVCEPRFIKPREIEFEPQAELRAIAASSSNLDYYLVDAAGRVTILERAGRKFKLAVVDTVEVSSRPLVDVVVAGAVEGTRVWVVDEVGTVHASVDAGRTWTSHPLDTELEPHGLVQDGAAIIVYGDDFVRALDGDEWFELPVPDGGWGSLRTATTLGDSLVLSDGESLLLDVGYSEYSWQRIEAPTEVLTLAASRGHYLIGGRQGLVLETISALAPDSTWDVLQLDTDADVVAIEGRAALTNAGELFDLDTLGMLDVGDANVGMAHSGADYLIFGANGPLLTTNYESCFYAH
jgi:photosystem II stability/assembly factor-like uncharacterized protein